MLMILYHPWTHSAYPPSLTRSPHHITSTAIQFQIGIQQTIDAHHRHRHCRHRRTSHQLPSCPAASTLGRVVSLGWGDSPSAPEKPWSWGSKHAIYQWQSRERGQRRHVMDLLPLCPASTELARATPCAHLTPLSQGGIRPQSETGPQKQERQPERHLAPPHGRRLAKRQ